MLQIATSSVPHIMGNVTSIISGIFPMLALLFGVLFFVFIFEQIVYMIYPPVYEKENEE